MRHQRIFGVATPLLFGAALLAGGSSTASAACGLQSADNRIKHVVHIQFDNVHLRRDNPNVPSDLEQMPNLLNFMQNNGTVSELAQVYKQLNAPLGSVGLNSLRFANRSILSDDAVYSRFLATIADITSKRDALAAEIKSVLDGAAFDDQPINDHQEEQLARRARAVIYRVADLAHDDHDHDRDHDNDHH